MDTIGPSTLIIAANTRCADASRSAAPASPQPAAAAAAPAQHSPRSAAVLSRDALRTYARATFPSTPRSIPILTMSQTLIPLFTNVAREEGVVADYVTRSGAEGPSHISRHPSLRGKQKPKKSLKSLKKA